MEQTPDFSISLKGKTALVTGGGAGIGQRIATAYAALGAEVAVLEIDAERAAAVKGELDAIGHKNIVLRADVTDSNAVKSAMHEIDEKFGKLDILVNNVGDNLRLRGSFESFSEAGWDALYGINLRHIFIVTKASLPLLRKGGIGGSIINISTIEAYRGAPPAAIYAAFKSGITGFTRSLALELAPEQIRVNIIAPETTITPQVPIMDMIADEYKDHIERWIPLGRFGMPRDVAGCAVFLATDLSAWVTGTTVHVDGGALAAGGFYRAPDGGWTNFPVIRDVGIKWRPPKA
jgi:3-oxoacyl-[acyl-carrier protein] reductase